MSFNQSFALLALWLGTLAPSWGQGLLDISVGTSFQDNVAAQLTYSQQFSERFRVGIALQYGAPSYRFVGAQPFQNTGYSYTVAVPLFLELVRQERIQLHGLLKLGGRFQGVIDPDENDRRDSLFQSTAVLAEIGFLVNLPLSERVHVQSGLSFPIVYELAPSPLLEYQWSRLHAGASYALDRQVLFLKGSVGPAFGASGDTYKFIWDLQAGVRLKFGNSPALNSHFIETSF